MSDVSKIETSDGETVRVGPLRFDYDGDRHELFVSRAEETLAMVEGITQAEWDDFVDAIFES